MELTDATYNLLRQHIKKLCGLTLLDDRQYLIHHRLGKLVHQYGLGSFDSLAIHLREGGQEDLKRDVVEAILTGETSFFRDPHVFSALSKEVLPQILEQLDQVSRPLRIFSAGVSTGQEAYSLAMLLEEHLSRTSLSARQPFSIVATDISITALSIARNGVYHARELDRGLCTQRKATYFDPLGNRFKIKQHIRDRIEFTQINLNEPLMLKGSFDLVCCRNVMIYFDETLRRCLCEQFHRLLHPQGWLVLGAAESLYGMSSGYRSVELEGNVFCYQREDARSMNHP